MLEPVAWTVPLGFWFLAAVQLLYKRVCVVLRGNGNRARSISGDVEAQSKRCVFRVNVM